MDAASASVERALAERLVLQRRVPHRDLACRARGAVAVHERDVVQAGQPLRQLDRVRDRRAGEQDARLGPVRGGDAAQASQDVRDVRAEHAAVHVRLVDDDDGEVREDVRPRVVVREDPDVEHVGVREDEVRPPADGGALVAGRVAVVDRGTHPLAQPELGDRAGLVLRQRLRGVEVDRARLRVAAEHVERRQVEAQRLARRRAGGDDRRAVPRALQRLGLVRVQLLDPGGCQCVAQRGVQLVGHRDERRLARALVRLAHEAPVVQAGLQQRRPTAPCERLRRSSPPS